MAPRQPEKQWKPARARITLSNNAVWWKKFRWKARFKTINGDLNAVEPSRHRAGRCGSVCGWLSKGLVKKCSYCGRENVDDATQCRECGTSEFVVPAPAPTRSRIEHDKGEPEATTLPEDSIPELPISGESVVCPTCHALNVPDVAFCRRCGAPIGFISTIGPLETAYAEGFALRQAVQGRPKFVVVLGIWLLFFPVLVTTIGFGFAILKEVMDGNGGVVGLIGFLLFWICVGFAAISAIMLYRVTKNFFTIPKQKLDATDA